MRKVIIMFALAMGIVTANAQENVAVGTDNGSEPTNEARAEANMMITFLITLDFSGK